MRVLNASLIALVATVSTLALSGCLGTNTPATAPAIINESASGTGYVLARGAEFDTMTTTVAAGAINGGNNDAGASGVTPAVFTAYTNSSTGDFGFIVNLPADATPAGVANTAVLATDDFTASTQVEFPAGTQQASSIATDTAGTVSTVGTGGTADGGHISVDKFGASQSLQNSDYGIWAENGTTAGLSATTASTVGVFAVGIPTAVMPVSGTAVYHGGAAGIATSTNGGGEFSGTTTMNATFTGVGGGTITGAITDIKFLPAGAANIAGSIGTMNDITLAGGTITGNTFAGTTSVAGSSTGGTGANFAIAGAGTFGGQFNGLTAAEVAGTFKLASGGGGATQTNIIGSFGAHQ